ncbi:hypothetical protein G5I_08999 [Acromyrmex echinatior]|uniref:Uncharacterized protein n=1 Tax=Acromyrmex echinatior TaxID=103372 RepID=F4WT25_ACREC|nr:hypothetical protein G5I_08999 [Acromyrmex echinatior]
MSDSCATTPPLPPPSGDYANVIINCQCSLFNDSSSRSLNTPNCRDVTKIAIQVHRCVSKLLIRRDDLRNCEALFLVIIATICEDQCIYRCEEVRHFDVDKSEPREKTNKPIKMSFNATSLFTVYHSDCVLASTLPRIPATKCHLRLRAHKDHRKKRATQSLGAAGIRRGARLTIEGLQRRKKEEATKKKEEGCDPDTHREITAGGVRDVTWHGRHACTLVDARTHGRIGKNG